MENFTLLFYFEGFPQPPASQMEYGEKKRIFIPISSEADCEIASDGSHCHIRLGIVTITAVGREMSIYCLDLADDNSNMSANHARMLTLKPSCSHRQSQTKSLQLVIIYS